jgi:signal transduction histidine kinase
LHSDKATHKFALLVFMATNQAGTKGARARWARFFFVHSKSFQFLLSTVFVAIAFGLRKAFAEELGPSMPFTFFVNASILSACFGGWMTGFYSMLLGWFLGDFFFISPIGTLGHYGKAQAIALVANFLPNTIAILALELLHRSRKARELAEARLARANEQIQKYNLELESRVKTQTAELQSSLEFLQKFCYSIAHDLRAPLRAIRGFALALEEDYRDSLDETARQYTSRMAIAVEKMDRLITDLLDYGRLSHQRLDLEDIDVSDCLESALVQLQHQIDEIGPVIEKNNLHASVVADKRLLADVFRRLISNALKFRKPEVPLRIVFSCQEAGPLIRFSCTDNGIGIGAEYLQKVFGLFETLAPSLDTGAGLAFISKALDRMHGNAGVSSAKGQGSTFWIELPKAKMHLLHHRRHQSRWSR